MFFLPPRLSLLRAVKTHDLSCTKIGMALLCAAKIFASGCAKFIKQKSHFSIWTVFFTIGLVAAVPLSSNVLQGGFLTPTKAT